MNVVIKRFSFLLVCSIGLFPLFTSCDKTEEELFESIEKETLKEVDNGCKSTRTAMATTILTVKYSFSIIGDFNSKPEVDPLYVQRVITGIVSRHYTIVMMPVGIAMGSVTMRVAPYGSGPGYDIAWMMNEIYLSFLHDGYVVLLEYTCEDLSSSSDPDSEPSNKPSVDDSETGNPYPQQPTLPDTCRSLKDVVKFLVPFLEKKGVKLDGVQIGDCSDPNEDPTISAFIRNGEILLCKQFYRKRSSDQYSVLWHKIYNLQCDEFVVSRLQPLSSKVNFVLPDEIRAYATTFLQGVYVDLAASERERKIDREISGYLEMIYMYPPVFYLNEINAYEAERIANENISESYHAEREFMYWLNRARYEVALNNYKL